MTRSVLRPRGGRLHRRRERAVLGGRSRRTLESSVVGRSRLRVLGPSQATPFRGHGRIVFSGGWSAGRASSRHQDEQGGRKKLRPESGEAVACHGQAFDRGT